MREDGCHCEYSRCVENAHGTDAPRTRHRCKISCGTGIVNTLCTTRYVGSWGWTPWRSFTCELLGDQWPRRRRPRLKIIGRRHRSLQKEHGSRDRDWRSGAAHGVRTGAVASTLGSGPAGSAPFHLVQPPQLAHWSPKERSGYSRSSRFSLLTLKHYHTSM